MIKKLTIETASRQGYVVIDSMVREAIAESGVQNGICVISLDEDAGGLGLTSTWDLGGMDDMVNELWRCVPPRVTYLHQRSPIAAAAHTRSVFTSCSYSIVVKEGQPLAGHSQSFVLFEFDGPETRNLTLSVVEAPFYYEVFQFDSYFNEIHDITDCVRTAVKNSGYKNGFCHLTVVAATAGIAMCPTGSERQQDIVEDFDRLITTRADFNHRESAYDPSGHIKTCISGTQLNVPFENGGLLLGEESCLCYAEFDGPRPRDVRICVFKDEAGHSIQSQT
ncbi:MAG: YjbQ family protein [Lachnospiraceae bacterium]|nr:YjbQ family protein [Lachnospiraceae bacterium]